jgi:hypothetical protein
MPLIDFKALQRLPPDQRVKALERLEEQLQKLITQRNQEIEQSKREITEAESLLQRARDELVVLEKIETPEARPVLIDDLFFKKPHGQGARKPAESLVEKAERPDELRMRLEESEQERARQQRASLEAVAGSYQRPQQERPFDPQSEAYRTAIGPQELERPSEPRGGYKKRDDRPKLVGEGRYHNRDDD